MVWCTIIHNRQLSNAPHMIWYTILHFPIGLKLVNTMIVWQYSLNTHHHRFSTVDELLYLSDIHRNKKSSKITRNITNTFYLLSIINISEILLFLSLSLSLSVFSPVNNHIQRMSYEQLSHDTNKMKSTPITSSSETMLHATHGKLFVSLVNMKHWNCWHVLMVNSWAHTCSNRL
jgi:hypothetical protein